MVVPALVVAAVLGVALTGLWAGQRSLIYLPDRSRPAPPPDVVEVTLATGDGLDLTAWWLTATPRPDAAVIVFPGNAGNRTLRLPLARALVDSGLAVLLVDYRGYGGNPGRPSEEGLLADAHAARAWVGTQGVSRVVYFGESVGAGPATALALESAPDALVLRSPFTSLADAARVHYPFLPTGLLVWDRFPVADQVADVAAPVVVVAGSADTIIPIELSRAVADAAGAELIVLDGADHNDAALSSGSRLVDAIADAALP